MILKEIAEIFDCEHKTAPTQDIGYPSIRTPNVGKGRLILEGVNRVSEETYRNWTRRAIPRTNDLILAREAPVGNVAIIRDGQKVCLGQRTVLIRPNPKIVNPAYLTYLLIGDEIQGVFKGVSAGATVAHLNVEDIRNLKLPELPPLPIQKRIGDILSAYYDLTENNLRRIQLLEEMARNIYHEWFVKFRFPIYRKDGSIERIHNPETDPMQDSQLGPIPKGWEETRLGDICKEIRRSVNLEEIPPDTPYIGLEHMPRRSITLSEWGNLDKVISTKLRYETGDILFCKIRPYFHKVGFTLTEGVCSSDAIVIIPLKKDFFPLTLSCVSSEDFVSHAVQTSQGTKMPRANWKVLIQYPCPKPSGNLLISFNDVILNITKKCRFLALNILTLKKTRDLLLPKLIAGEIKV